MRHWQGWRECGERWGVRVMVGQGLWGRGEGRRRDDKGLQGTRERIHKRTEKIRVILYITTSISSYQTSFHIINDEKKSNLYQVKNGIAER